MVGTSAVACGVISEAIYAGLVRRPVVHNELRLAPVVEPPLTWQVFSAFYFPLVMTSLLSLLANPIGSAALSRMPYRIGIAGCLAGDHRDDLHLAQPGNCV